MLTDRIADKTLPITIPVLPEEARTLSQQVAYLLSDVHDTLPKAAAVLADLHSQLPNVIRAAFIDEDNSALLDVHKALFVIYEISFMHPLSAALAHERSSWLLNIRNAIEEAWLRYVSRLIEAELPSMHTLKSEDEFAAWFIDQARRESPTDRMVARFLAEQATLDQFKTFILSDMCLNYRFYDALVLAQLHFSECIKQELSQHFWDECGRGEVTNSHTQQFTRVLDILQLLPARIPIWNDWRPYAGYNLYLFLGLKRRHYFKALGSLAMPELFDPNRDRAVIAGLDRLNFDAKPEFEYYHAHVDGDEAHGSGWLNHVILPIGGTDPEVARELAIGGALRMVHMRLFNAYLADKFDLFQ